MEAIVFIGVFVVVVSMAVYFIKAAESATVSAPDEKAGRVTGEGTTRAEDTEGR